MLKVINPLNWLKWGGQFIYAYLLSIPWREASKAIPALVLLIVVFVGTAIAYTGGGDLRNKQINQQLASAYDIDDFETAELLLRRQIASRPDDLDVRFRLGMVYSEQEKTDEAKAIMQSLARGNRHLESAQWLLQNEYLGKKWNELSEDDKEEFGDLLELIGDEKPGNSGIMQLRADYLIATQRFAKAIPFLRQLAENQPMRGLQAAALSRRLGNTAAADKLAETTLERVEDLFEEEPANPILALAVVQNQLFLERHAEAVRTLDASIGRMKTKEHRLQLQQAMGDTIVAWIKKIEDQPNDTATERLRVLKMLQLALRYAPNNPRVLTLVADQVLKTLESEDDGVIAIRNALVKGTSPGIAHFVRGTSYLMKGDPERASRHLKLAAEHLPNSSAILNNLAVAMSSLDSSNLEDALKLSNQAIKQAPKAGPYFYETRGQILFRLERYLDAIPDFERALAVDALAQKSHRRLADCYKALDEPDLAAAHLDAAETLASKVDEKDTDVDEPLIEVDEQLTEDESGD